MSSNPVFKKNKFRHHSPIFDDVWPDQCSDVETGSAGRTDDLIDLNYFPPSLNSTSTPSKKDFTKGLEFLFSDNTESGSSSRVGSGLLEEPLANPSDQLLNQNGHGLGSSSRIGSNVHAEKLEELSGEVKGQREICKFLHESEVKSQCRIRDLKKECAVLKKQLFESEGKARNNKDLLSELSQTVGYLVQTQKADNLKITQLEKVYKADRQKIGELEEARKADQLKIVGLEKVNENYGQTIFRLKNELDKFKNEIAQIKATQVEAGQQNNFSASINEIRAELEEMLKDKATNFSNLVEATEEKFQGLKIDLKNCKEIGDILKQKRDRYGKYANFSFDIQQPVSEQLLTVLPLSNHTHRLNIRITSQDSAFEQPWQDGQNTILCWSAFFSENLDNIGKLIFNGQGHEMYPEGLHIIATEGVNISAAFFDDVIKSAETTESPEKVGKYFYVYFNCWNSLPNWWAENESAVEVNGGRHKLESVVINRHNKTFKFLVTIQSDGEKNKMDSFCLEKLL